MWLGVFWSPEFQASHCSMNGYVSIVVHWGSNPGQVSLSLLDSICLLWVCTTAKMRADIEDYIMHMYVQLSFEIIPASTTITYIHTNIEVHTITSIQSARRWICYLSCGTR